MHGLIDFIERKNKMKKVEITYVARFEITKTVEVSEEDYNEITEGCGLPDDLEEELCNLAMTILISHSPSKSHFFATLYIL